jgi:lambda family phage portal protein
MNARYTNVKRGWLAGLQFRVGQWLMQRNITVFNASAGTRLLQDWVNAPILSADQEIKGNLRLLRGRARELARNNAVARSYLKILIANVLGERGIGWQPLVHNNSGEQNIPFNQKIQKAWREWARRGNCTVDGKLSFRALQNLALKSVATDGECFVRMIPGFANKYRFALQMIDADQVDHLYSRFASREENEIRMGVEVDKWGKPVAYYVNPAHPSDLGGSLLRDRIPAEYVLHLYDPDRVSQTRGIPWFSPCMLEMRMIGGYMEAELVAARVSAAKIGFFKHTDAAAYGEATEDEHRRVEANPGVIEELPPGLEFQAWNPEHPPVAFPNFIKAALRFVAGAMGVSYNALASDLEGVNYSSMRSGLLIERDQWKICQSFLKEDFLDPIFSGWLSMALLSGALVLDSREPSRFLEGKWEARGWPWVDPLKDVQASILGIGAGLRTRDRVISEEGGDVEEVFEQLEEEKKLADSHGLEFTIDARPPVINKGPKEQVTAGDEEPETPPAEVEAKGGGRKLAVLGRGNG